MSKSRVWSPFLSKRTGCCTKRQWQCWSEKKVELKMNKIPAKAAKQNTQSPLVWSCGQNSHEIGWLPQGHGHSAEVGGHAKGSEGARARSHDYGGGYDKTTGSWVLLTRRKLKVFVYGFSVCVCVCVCVWDMSLTKKNTRTHMDCHTYTYTHIQTRTNTYTLQHTHTHRSSRLHVYCHLE